MNHPAIAAVYGLEESGGTTAIVLELVEGETLAERVERSGRVPLDDALAIARQIAEALEAAHDRGVVHRDLKPANIKVTPDGRDPGPDIFPVWSPDGGHIAFQSTRGGIGAVYWQRADGTGPVELLSRGAGQQVPNAFTPDGKSLVVSEANPKTLFDLILVPLDGSHTSKPLIQTPFNEFGADLSPDGRYIAHTSNESGPLQVFVRPFPNVESGRWQVSSDVGDQAAWARNGRELFYVGSRGRLMSVPVRTDSDFSAGRPVLMHERLAVSVGGSVGLGSRFYDPSPDGRRFLLAKTAARQDANRTGPELMVVLNWSEELKRLAPAR